MKKTLLSILCLMQATFSIQAQEVTLDFTTNNWGLPTDYTKTESTFTNGDYTIRLIAATNGYKHGGNYLLLGKKDATLTLPAFDFAVSKIKVYGRSGASGKVTENIFVGDIAVSEEKTSAIEDHEFDINENYRAAGNIYTLKVTNGNNTQITKIEVYKLDATATAKPEISTPDNATTFEESLEVTITATEGAKIYYTLDGSEPTTESTEYTAAFTINATTTVKAIAVIGENKSQVTTATYSKIATDTLNRDFTGVTGSHYKEWTGKTAPSTSVYAGSTAGSYEAIQLRSTNHSGIITTKSGGKAKRIVIEWNEKTDTVRKISIYGKNSAYTTASELYANATQGEKLAELVYGTTEFTLTGEYKYIGLRSYSNTIYLNSIKITWEEDESTSQPYILNVSEVGYATLMLGYNAVIPAGVEAYIVSSTSGSYATLTKITTNILPANEAVIIKANAGTYEFAQTTDESTIEDNLLMGTLSDIEVEADAYVLSKPAGEELGLYMAAKNRKNNTAFLNNASKAYLPLSNTEKASLSTSLRFEFSGTTAIEEVEGNSEDAEIIYDLAGRRIERITEPGIYIIGGKKRVVK